MSVDASAQDFGTIAEIGLGCWQGVKNDSPGYHITFVPDQNKFAMWKSPATEAESVDIPATASGERMPELVEGEAFHLRADCLASSSGETTPKLFLNGTLVGTGHDAKGLNQSTLWGLCWWPERSRPPPISTTST